MLTIWHFQKIYILSLAEHSDERMKHLYLGLSFTFFFVRHDRSLRTPPIFGDERRETKARNPSLVRTADLFAQKLTSFTLCYYVIGLFNSAQTNYKDKRKRMLFGCEQPFLWGSVTWHPKKRLRRRLANIGHLTNYLALSILHIKHYVS